MMGPGSAEALERAFSKQSVVYDRDDARNIILRDLRKQVYEHVEQFISPGSRILELNAGTGIDAIYFARAGHTVLATDASRGMIDQIKRKIAIDNPGQRLTCRRLSYENLDLIEGTRFNYVFSNFGGLNCTPDLSRITRHLPVLLDAGAHLTWVIMPPVCPWEILGAFKGNGSKAFRRLTKGGALSHLEGEYFTTYYHSLNAVRSALGPTFKLVAHEGLAAISPPPHHSNFAGRHPRVYSFLRKADKLVRNHFPFNRWADHIIVTFRYEP
ncbi:MAG TPA: class I SAM-dependent methyltransferase [Cyclobacteriaceae bacterium]